MASVVSTSSIVPVASPEQRAFTHAYLLLKIVSCFHEPEIPSKQNKTYALLKRVSRPFYTAITQFSKPTPKIIFDAFSAGMSADFGCDEFSSGKGMKTNIIPADLEIPLHQDNPAEGRFPKRLSQAQTMWMLQEQCFIPGGFYYEGNLSLAQDAFKTARYQQASLLIRRGARFKIVSEDLSSPVEKSLVRGITAGDSLFLDFPLIALTVREVRWKTAETPEKKLSELTRMWIDACRMGSLDTVKWALEKRKSSELMGMSISLFRPLAAAVRGGFGDIVEALLNAENGAAFPSFKKRYLVHLSIRSGHPHIGKFLMKHGFPVADQTDKILNAFISALEEAQFLLKSLSPPIPNSPVRLEGEKPSDSIYRKEYQEAVASTKFLLSQKYSIIQIIESLGARRLRIAVLCGVSPLESFGHPNVRRQMYTIFEWPFEAEGKRIRKKYDKRLPVQVVYKCKDGTLLPLTRIASDAWYHPPGDEKVRRRGFEEIEILTKEILSSGYSNHLARLADDIARIYWLFAHLAPFERGTPTISGIFTDALYLAKGNMPPEKRFDENCEALEYDTWEEFAETMAGNKDLPEKL